MKLCRSKFEPGAIVVCRENSNLPMLLVTLSNVDDFPAVVAADDAHDHGDVVVDAVHLRVAGHLPAGHDDERAPPYLRVKE